MPNDRRRRTPLLVLTVIALLVGLVGVVPGPASAAPALSPTLDAPVVSGVAQRGGALTAVAGTYNATPDAVSYQWQAGGANVGTDTFVYRPTAADLDKTVTVTVTATKAGYVDAVTTSAPTSGVLDGGRIAAWGYNGTQQTDVPDSLTGETVTAIAAGTYHSLALTADGTVTAWGYNGYGQINVPTSLTGKTVVAIAAGTFHSLALTADGTVTAWGYNGHGQTTVPTSLTGKAVVAIAALASHSLALTADGTVTAWGYNSSGQTTVPTSLTGDTVVAIAAGADHSLALTADGTVTGWGHNGAGQTDVPTSLTGQTVTAIAAGTYHSLALAADGTVTGWGDNSQGQTNVPTSLTGETVVAIAAAPFHSLALTADGTVTGWGYNAFGQTTVPTSLTGKTVTAVTAGGDHSLALVQRDPLVSGVAQRGGTLIAVAGTYNATPDALSYEWKAGGTDVGTNSFVYRPTAADLDKTITVTVTATKAGGPDAVTTSAPTSAVVDGGRLTGWGNNSSGQTNVPASLTGETVTAIAAGDDHSLALTADGTVTAWGDNDYGQVNVPASLTGKTVVAIAAGTYHSLALTADGTVTAWGDNTAGQTTVPARLTGKTVVAIAAGTYHSLALTADGTVTAWGDNTAGQTTVPASLTGKAVVAVAAGALHSLVLAADGTVTGWGYNSSGQANVPASLTGKTVVAIVAGYYHSLALAADGTVTGWGDNGDGQTTVPGSLTGKTVAAVAAGAYHSLALTAGGTVTAWGYNSSGQTNVPTSLTGTTVTIASGGVHSLAIARAVRSTTLPTITGTAKVGGTLTAGTGTTVPVADSYTYQWYADDVAITDATAATYVLTADEHDANITVKVTATKAKHLPASATSAAVGPVDAGTFATGPAATITGTPAVGQTLTAGHGTTVPSTTGFSYQWSRDGDTIANATAATYVLVAADKDADISVKVTATLAGYTDATDTSDDVGPVTAGTFTSGPTATITGTTKVGQTLTAGAGTTVPTTTDLSYRWLRDGDPITDATAATYVPVAADQDADISVTVTATLAGYADATDTSDDVGPVTAGTFTSGPTATITGTTKVGQTLTAGHGTTAPTTSDFTYQWLRDGDPIVNATGTTYVLVAADQGADITVTVTGTLAGYLDAADTSAVVGPIAAAPAPPTPPTFTTGPVATISGTVQVGQTLAADHGDPAPTPDTVTYQWHADDTPIPDATEVTYLLTAAERGTRITVSVTIARAGYTSATDTSDPTGPVASATAPTLELTADKNRIRRGAPVTLTWTSNLADTLTAGGWTTDQTLPGTGTRTLRPTVLGTHTYTLSATNDRGTTTAQVILTVVREAKNLTVRAPAKVRRTKTLRVRAHGLDPAETYTIRFGSTLLTGRADKHGRIERRLTIPRTAHLGRTRLSITGSTGDRTGAKTIRVRRAPRPHGHH